MSIVTKEWIAVLIFVLCFLGYSVGEAVWLKRKGWASLGRSLAFAAATNFFGYAIGFFVLFVVFGVVLAMAWDGSLNQFPLNDYGIAVVLILAVLFVPVLLALSKRLLLKLFKLQTGKSAWLFSILSAILILIFSIGLPILFLYVF